MKTKLFILLLFSSLTKFAIAQYVSEADNQYKWSISAAINSVEAQMDQKLFDTWASPYVNYYDNYGNKKNKSLSFSIIPKYRITEDMLLRFEYGVTNIDLQSNFNGIGDTLTQSQGQALGSANTISYQTISQKIYRYAAGVQWNFMKKKFIETYCGALLNYLHYSDMQWSQRIISNTTVGRGTNYTSATPGGFATGIGAFSGFNIYVHKQISIGGEFSYSLLYYKLGGVQSGVQEHIFPTTPTLIFNWKNYNNASEGIQFSKVLPSLNLTIRF
ncbi:MAG: hypothetical protein Q8L90_12820 [Bacteroidota bacterium]|nr:hypothetical protein [Bacteroidota bacterium]